MYTTRHHRRYHAATSKHRSQLISRRRVLVPAALLGATIALAAPGDLDVGFGDGGTLSFGVGLPSQGFSGIEQADGKLVVAGAGTGFNDDSDFLVARFAADGSPDTAFGNLGNAVLDFAGSDDIGYVVVQQADGSLVAAGGASNLDGSIDVALVRYAPDGTLDATFGNGGMVKLDLGGDDEFATGLVQQPDGRLVVAGTSNVGGPYRMMFARLNTDGSIDTTFGDSGVTLLGFEPDDQSQANWLLAQPDGKLVAAGVRVSATDLAADFAVARVTPDGQPDPSFDGDGTLVVDVGGSDDVAGSVALQPDGKLVLAGFALGSADLLPDAALVRVDASGALDPGFGTAGKAVIDLGGESVLNSVLVEADGRVFATGLRGADFLFALEPTAPTDMILARFGADGRLDGSYGIDGVATADFGFDTTPPVSLGFALLRQDDGKYIVVGSNIAGQAIAVARFDNAASSPGRIGLTNTIVTVDEDAGSVSYAVRRTGGAAGAVSVDYATSDGFATAGSDFVQTNGRLSWADGDTAVQTVTVPLLADSTVEDLETFFLTLSGVTGGARLAGSTATTNIVDATANPGALAFLSSIEPVQENRGTTLQVPVQRAGGSSGVVSVDFATASGSAASGDDFQATSGTLTWADGDTAIKSIAVVVIDDGREESNESFSITLSNPRGGATLGANPVTTVSIDDDDSPLPGTDETGPAAGGCFIATAAFGTPMVEEVRYLRGFRDQYLLTNDPGRAFVRFYYRHSPPIADYLREHDSLRAIVRVALQPLIGLSELLVSVEDMEAETAERP